MKKGIFLILIFGFDVQVFAQNNCVQTVNATLAIGKYQGSLSIAAINDWHIGKKGKFLSGLGIRFTTYLGTGKDYLTAPAKITSGETGPQVLFVENIDANIDTLIIKRPQVNAINLMIDLGYQFNDRWVAGFNIDVTGFSFGSARRSNYITTQDGVKSGKMETAKPTSFNLLLVSDNDLGSLNSELYAVRSIGRHSFVKAGLQFLFTEYTTNTNVQEIPSPNDRFRLKSLMFCLGIIRRIK